MRQTRLKVLLIIMSVFYFSCGSVNADLNTGLKAYYPFNGNANDESGNGYHGTLNGPVLAADKDGMPDSAYNFDGIDDYIEITGLNDLSGNAISITFWFKGTNFFSGISQYLNNEYYVASPFQSNHLLSNDGLLDGISVDGNDGNSTNDGSWHHIAMTWEIAPGYFRSYFDGVKVDERPSSSVPIPDIGTDVRLGSVVDTVGFYTNGTIDEVRIYSRALEAGEIVNLAEFTLHTLDPPADPENPASAMYTLEDVYNHLDTGEAVSKREGGFSEPMSPPGISGYSIDEIMTITPTPDNTNGATPEEVAAGKTYWSLRTDGTWGQQTGTATPGGTRFVDNGNTVTDLQTNLMWLKTPIGTVMDWNTAMNYCNAYIGGGGYPYYQDWRLPHIYELVALIDKRNSNPALPTGHPFNVRLDPISFWSITNCNDDAWFIFIHNGNTSNAPKHSNLYVWPVRSVD